MPPIWLNVKALGLPAQAVLDAAMSKAVATTSFHPQMAGMLHMSCIDLSGTPRPSQSWRHQALLGPDLFALSLVYVLSTCARVDVAAGKTTHICLCSCGDDVGIKSMSYETAFEADAHMPEEIHIPQ